MSDDHKFNLRKRFGASSEAYATSYAHSKGESLNILLQLINPKRSWKMLDVATGAGHTAMLFAPYVARVTALDITEEMVLKTIEMAAIKGVGNIDARVADAESMPFEDNTFDLVTCRLAFHHFTNQNKALSEMVRVLKPGGILGFVDNMVVDDPTASQYYNMVESIRDPTHRYVYPKSQLIRLLQGTGLKIVSEQELCKETEFNDWAARQSVSESDKNRLIDLIKKAPEPLLTFFHPRIHEKSFYFNLCEAIIIATKV
jgi:ubiquinone/menaquinone biosynthesis C-methylase UbiE